MSVTFKFEGGREIERASRELGDTRVAKRAGRAALIEAGEPMRALAERLAPEDEGDLKRSVKMATGRNERGSDGDQTSVVIGIDANVQPAREVQRKDGKGSYRDPGVAGVAVIKELGSEKDPAQPFMRPAWDALKGGLPKRIGRSMGPAIEAEARKLARRRGKS